MKLIHRVAMAAVFWTAALGSVPRIRAQDSSSLTGTVVDATGAVIQNAAVVLKQAGQQTRRTLADRAGSFTFSMRPGEYVLEVSSPGFATSTLGITVSGGESIAPLTIRLDVGPVGSCGNDDLELPEFSYEPLRSDRGEITGATVNIHGESLKGVAVTISLPDGRHSGARTTTDEWGKFTVTGLGPGVYSLTASMPLHIDFVVKAIRVSPGQRTRINPALPLDDCPEGVACQPANKLRIPICL
jgi:hypothetical protein